MIKFKNIANGIKNEQPLKPKRNMHLDPFRKFPAFVHLCESLKIYDRY